MAANKALVKIEMLEHGAVDDAVFDQDLFKAAVLRFFLIVVGNGEDRQLSICLENCIADILQVCDILVVQLLIEIVNGEAQPVHHLLVDLAVCDHNTRVSGDKGAQARALERDK